MITLGLDPHPGSHTVVALNENGTALGHLAVPNTPESISQLHEFGSGFSLRRWAIEGAGNHFIAAFVAELLASSESVFSIPPSLTSQYRARRGRKKSDLIEAENVARALLANPQLPALHAVEHQRELQEQTRTQRRLSEQLRASRDALQELTADSSVRGILEPIIEILVDQLNILQRRIRLMVNALMPALLEVQGVGPIVAGILLAETGDPNRFSSANHFASYCGAAPVERGSGQNCRMQVNPGGNRRLNWALHIVAIVRLRIDGGRSRALLEKCQLRGKSRRSALRVLKTYIARELFGVMQQNNRARLTALPT